MPRFIVGSESESENSWKMCNFFTETVSPQIFARIPRKSVNLFTEVAEIREFSHGIRENCRNRKAFQ